MTLAAPTPAVDAATTRRPTQRRRWLGLLVSTALLAAVCVASLAIGTQTVGLSTVWQAVTDYRDIGDQWIVHELRISRTALAIVVGIALGLSGTLIQSVGRNPLADAEILGINSGAALFIVTAIALLGVTGPGTYIWFGFAGALFAMVLVYLIGMTGRAMVTPVRVSTSLRQHAVLGCGSTGRGGRCRSRPPSSLSSRSVLFCASSSRALSLRSPPVSREVPLPWRWRCR